MRYWNIVIIITLPTLPHSGEWGGVSTTDFLFPAATFLLGLPFKDVKGPRISKERNFKPGFKRCKNAIDGRGFIFIFILPLKWSFILFCVDITNRHFCYIGFPSGEKANPKTTELTASQLALTEEAPFEEQVTHGTSRDSWLGQAWYQEKLSEMQEGNWRPGADLHKETCLRKLSHKPDDFETDDSLCLGVLPEQVTIKMLYMNVIPNNQEKTLLLM